MAQLYHNSKGYPVRIHSYSAGEQWKYCPRRYKLARVDGWRERRRSAAMEFGNCVEAAVKAHCLGTGEILTVFEKAWGLFNPAIAELCDHAAQKPCKSCAEAAKRNAELKYSEKQEKDWGTLAAIGVGLLRLFTVMAPGLPIVKPRFGLELEKEVFPGSTLGGIKFKAIIDCLSSPSADHPLLPKITENEEKLRAGLGQPRPLIIDIKTAGKMYVTDPSLIALDPQLHSYAWTGNVFDVAFLVFVKTGLKMERGSSVTPLVGPQAGVRMTCVEPLEAAENETGKHCWLVIPDSEELQKGLEDYTAGLTAKAKITKRREFAANAGFRFAVEDLTTQRIQFLPARISPQDAAESGEVIGQQLAEIAAASGRNFFPKLGGIRWPNDRCLNCEMRGICGHNDALRDELVFKPEESWLLEEAEEEAA